jgi:hypothetical protein
VCMCVFSLSSLFSLSILSLSLCSLCVFSLSVLSVLSLSLVYCSLFAVAYSLPSPPPLSLTHTHRRFFTEFFPSPPDWFERRLAYTRSVAASSMAGFVLGLGDRHPQNILIDKMTAELVHIDLGVAFEQGTLLTTPETVPFRLTRDIVDGMGAMGVDGVFRRCCEETLKVFRSNKVCVCVCVCVT